MITQPSILPFLPNHFLHTSPPGTPPHHTLSALELFLLPLLEVIFLTHEWTTFTHCPGTSSDSATG